jgi:hypothetical protein
MALGTYGEMRQEYTEAMGAKLGKLYHILWNDCAHVHVKWDEFVELFGTDDQRQFDVMNGVAPGFFYSVQHALWEGILLHLCRLTDPAVVAHRKTLSLEALLKEDKCKDIFDLKERVRTAKERTTFARDWRNRVLAHSDLEYATNEQAIPLAPASRMQVREALEAIVEVLQAVESHFTDCELAFGGTRARWGGGNVISELDLISRLRAERMDRIVNRVPTQDDLDWDKWN